MTNLFGNSQTNYSGTISNVPYINAGPSDFYITNNAGTQQYYNYAKTNTAEAPGNIRFNTECTNSNAYFDTGNVTVSQGTLSINEGNLVVANALSTEPSTTEVAPQPVFTALPTVSLATNQYPGYYMQYYPTTTSTGLPSITYGNQNQGYEIGTITVNASNASNSGTIQFTCPVTAWLACLLYVPAQSLHNSATKLVYGIQDFSLTITGTTGFTETVQVYWTETDYVPQTGNIERYFKLEVSYEDSALQSYGFVSDLMYGEVSGDLRYWTAPFTNLASDTYTLNFNISYYGYNDFSSYTPNGTGGAVIPFLAMNGLSGMDSNYDFPVSTDGTGGQYLSDGNGYEASAITLVSTTNISLTSTAINTATVFLTNFQENPLSSASYPTNLNLTYTANDPVDILTFTIPAFTSGQVTATVPIGFFSYFGSINNDSSSSGAYEYGFSSATLTVTGNATTFSQTFNSFSTNTLTTDTGNATIAEDYNGFCADLQTDLLTWVFSLSPVNEAVTYTLQAGLNWNLPSTTLNTVFAQIFGQVPSPGAEVLLNVASMTTSLTPVYEPASVSSNMTIIPINSFTGITSVGSLFASQGFISRYNSGWVTAAANGTYTYTLPSYISNMPFVSLLGSTVAFPVLGTNPIYNITGNPNYIASVDYASATTVVVTFGGSIPGTYYVNMLLY